MANRQRQPAQQRILETADRLFYAEGFRGVGIDRIVAEADVAKMTLYTHYASKDDLLIAVLRYREERVLEFFEAAMERHSKRSKDQLQSFFGALNDWFRSPGFRGCAFQNATVELADPKHPGTQFAREHKRRFSELLRGFIEQSVGPDRPKLAAEVSLLVEGAIMTAVVQGKADAADLARDAAFALAGSRSR